MFKQLAPAALAAALIVPTAAASAGAEDSPAPGSAELRAELAGHLTVGSQMRSARVEVLQRRLARVNLRIARKVARLQDDRVTRAERERILALPMSELERRNRVLRERLETLRKRAARKAARRRAAAAATPGAPATAQNATAAPAAASGGAATPGHLAAIAACESGGNPSAVGGGGQYRGKYQFSVSTWQSVGGTGDPAAASEAEQDARAAALYAQQGSSPWPVCGG
jgi:septal ring factor EnvC (AmiA/AmiB activator)